MIVMVRTKPQKDTDDKGSRDIDSKFLKLAEKDSKPKHVFLTLYDPRSATEYLCGWNKGSTLKTGSSEFTAVEMLMEAVGKAAENNELIMGPAITPRVEIQ